MTWKHLKFGIEFEGAPSHPWQYDTLAREAAQIGLFRPVASDGDDLTTQDIVSKWTFGCDGDGVEVRTPVMYFYELNDVAEMLSFLQSTGTKAGRSSGVHVHVGSGALNMSERANVVRHWWQWEPILTTLVPNSRLASGWCDPLSSLFFETPFPAQSDNTVLRYATKKAFGPNGGYPTFECRLHDSSFVFNHVAAWTLMLLAMVDHWIATPYVYTPQKPKKELLVSLEQRMCESFSGSLRNFILDDIHRRVGAYSCA